MRNYKLQDILNVTGGQLINVQDAGRVFETIGTDSRQNLKGKLFIALKGESFDAHEFLLQAVEQGAAGVLIHELPESQKIILNKTTIIKVDDTLKALQDIASWVRYQYQGKVLALTGSNGKTSTKEFAAQILSDYKNVHWSRGSFNNHWGVPFSLLDLENEHDLAIIEVGMNHAGEIRRLMEIADPDVVVCTMVGRAHIEFFGSQDKIAEAKQEIYKYSRPESVAIFNLDNEFTIRMWEQEKAAHPKRPILTFSQDRKADVEIRVQEITFEGLKLKGFIKGMPGEVFVPVFGKQNLTNLQAAASLALAAGLEPEQIWEGFKNCRNHWGRNQKVKLASGAMALFDAYNANPDSMEALLENVRAIEAPRKIGVFAQMRELGNLSAHFHEILGQQAGQSGFSKIFFYGDDFEAFQKGLVDSGFQGAIYAQKDFSDELAAKLSFDLKAKDFVVFKASRGPRLERMLLKCDPVDFSLEKG